MKRFLPLLLLAALLLAAPSLPAARPSTGGREITVFYSNDVRGELEPCG